MFCLTVVIDDLLVPLLCVQFALGVATLTLLAIHAAGPGGRQRRRERYRTLPPGWADEAVRCWNEDVPKHLSRDAAGIKHKPGDRRW